VSDALKKRRGKNKKIDKIVLLNKMRYIFDTPEMPEIDIIGQKKGRKSLKVNNNNVSHQYGKKNIF